MSSLAAAAPRSGAIAYWATTSIAVAALAFGGVSNLVRVEYVRDVMDQLGYPTYVPPIIGAWKLAGAAALAAPRFPRLKEWAYAGAIFAYTGAAASHLAAGDPAGAPTPLVLAAVTLASWALRPAARRGLAADPSPWTSDLRP